MTKTDNSFVGEETEDSGMEYTQAYENRPIAQTRQASIQKEISLPIGLSEEGQAIFAHLRFDAPLKKEMLISLKNLLEALEKTLAASEAEEARQRKAADAASKYADELEARLEEAELISEARFERAGRESAFVEWLKQRIATLGKHIAELPK